jgi:hypothetical protein
METALPRGFDNLDQVIAILSQETFTLRQA